MATSPLLDYLRVAERACAILPPGDVHGVGEVQQHFGVYYTDEQLAPLATLPWPDDVLRAFAGTHLLFAGFPLSVYDLQLRFPQFFWRKDQAWFTTHPFLCEARVSPRWHLVRKAPVPGSFGKTAAEQLSLLADEEEIPGACDLLLALLLHHAVTGERLLPKVWVRCAGYPPDRWSVVGTFVDGGLYVNEGDENSRLSYLGLTSGQIPPPSLVV